MDIVGLLSSHTVAVGGMAATLLWETLLGQTKHRSTVRLVVNMGASIFNALKAKLDAQDVAQGPTQLADADKAMQVPK